MFKTIACLLSVAADCLLLTLGVSRTSKASNVQNAMPTEGYTVHVSAPHVVNGKVMGRFLCMLANSCRSMKALIPTQPTGGCHPIQPSAPGGVVR